MTKHHALIGPLGIVICLEQLVQLEYLEIYALLNG